MLKKYPSRAAAYGILEYPSRRAKTEPKAVHRIMAVKIVATPSPYILSMKIETMKFDSGWMSAGTNSRQEMTPMSEKLIARYIDATARTLVITERGITFPGFFTSSAM